MRRRLLTLSVLAVVVAFAAAPATAAEKTTWGLEDAGYQAYYHGGPVDAEGSWLPGVHHYSSFQVNRAVWSRDGVPIDAELSATIQHAGGTVDENGVWREDYAVFSGYTVPESFTFGNRLSGGSVKASIPVFGCLQPRDENGLCSDPFSGTFTVDLEFLGTGNIMTFNEGRTNRGPTPDRLVDLYGGRERSATVSGVYLLDGAPAIAAPWNFAGIWTRSGTSLEIVK